MKRKYADIIRRHAQSKSDDEDDSPSFTDEDDEPPTKSRRRAPSVDPHWPSHKSGARNCRLPTARGWRRSTAPGPRRGPERLPIRLRRAPRTPRGRSPGPWPGPAASLLGPVRGGTGGCRRRVTPTCQSHQAPDTHSSPPAPRSPREAVLGQLRRRADAHGGRGDERRRRRGLWGGDNCDAHAGPDAAAAAAPAPAARRRVAALPAAAAGEPLGNDGAPFSSYNPPPALFPVPWLTVGPSRGCRQRDRRVLDLTVPPHPSHALSQTLRRGRPGSRPRG